MDQPLNPPMFKRQRDRKWEDLDTDSLMNVFAKVGMESLLLFVPFVCKSWHRASLNPECWHRIVFPDTTTGAADPWTLDHADDCDPWSNENQMEGAHFDHFVRRFAREFGIKWEDFSVPGFVKKVIDRSAGNAQFLKLPGRVTHYTGAVEEILEHVASNCKNFVGLHLSNGSIGNTQAAAIVSYVPKVKYLCLRKAKIARADLLMILQGCQELQLLDVRECRGFDEGDEEILRIARRIPKFQCGGSRVRAGACIEAVVVIELEDDEFNG